MAKMVVVHVDADDNEDGMTFVMLNPDHIVSVELKNSGNAVITLVNGKQFTTDPTEAYDMVTTPQCMDVNDYQTMWRAFNSINVIIGEPPK